MKRVIFAILVIAAGSIPVSAKYSGGTGTSDDPYQIANVTDLLTLSADANDYNKCFIMTADIDLDPNLPSGQVFTTAVIAPDINNLDLYDFNGVSFTGVFDGGGHKISNLKIDTNGLGNDYLGLFGDVNSGEIKNLKLENVSITDGNSSFYVGGLVGLNFGGSINNCYSTGLIKGATGTGGLVGYNYGSISNCYSTGNVTGSGSIGHVGGLVGDNYGSISNCYSTGSVSGFNSVGGLVGSNWTTISNCYSTRVVTGGNHSSFIGGLVGLNNNGPISNCYSTGMVSGTSNVGGLIGMSLKTVSHCYFLNTSGPSNGYGTPLTDTQMKQQANFTGWNFTTIWAICEGTNYPRLLWSILTADLVCPDGVNFADYSFFAQRWLNTNCAANNNCNGTDFDFSGTVDLADLKVFCNYWLQGL
jgi:hypothetical protein